MKKKYLMVGFIFIGIISGLIAWVRYAPEAHAFIDKPVYGYQAPCRPGISANVSTIHSPGRDGGPSIDRDRRAYDWRCDESNVHERTVHAPVSGRVAFVGTVTGGGMILIEDTTNEACAVLLHMESSANKVSVNDVVIQGQEVGAYSMGWGHVHMAAVDAPGGTCTSYSHSQERPIMFKEFGLLLPPAITLYGTVPGDDGPRQFVIAGQCINTTDINCSIPDDGGTDDNNQSYPLSKYFDDVGHNKFAVFIDAMKERGVTNGCSSSNPRIFCPDDTLTRGQAAAFMVRSLGLTPTQYASYSYPDVNGVGAFDNYIEYLTQLGVVSGYSDGQFKSDLPVERGQLAKMIINTLERRERSTYTCAPSGQTFPDIPTNHPFYNFIQCMAQSQITHGYSDGTFKSDRQITRAEASKLIYLALLKEIEYADQEADDVQNNSKDGASFLESVADTFVSSAKSFTLPHGDVDWFKFTLPTSRNVNAQSADIGSQSDQILVVRSGKNVNPCLTVEDELGNPVDISIVDLAHEDIIATEQLALRIDGVQSQQRRSGQNLTQTYYVGIENSVEFATESVNTNIYLQSGTIFEEPEITPTTRPSSTSTPTEPDNTTTSTPTQMATLTPTDVPSTPTQMATSAPTSVPVATSKPTSTPSSIVGAGREEVYLPLMQSAGSQRANIAASGLVTRNCFSGNQPISVPTATPIQPISTPTFIPTSTPTPVPPTSTPTPTSTPVPFSFTDNFSDESSGWRTTTASDYRTYYGSNDFRMDINGNNREVWETNDRAQVNGFDYVAEVDGELNAGGPIRYGLIFDILDSRNFYVFTVNPDAQNWRLELVRNGSRSTLREGTSSSIRQGGRINLIEIYRIGNTIRADVEFDTVTTISSREFTGNLRVGLVAKAGNDDATAEFDNFELREITR